MRLFEFIINGALSPFLFESRDDAEAKLREEMIAAASVPGWHSTSAQVSEVRPDIGDIEQFATHWAFGVLWVRKGARNV